MGSHRNWLRFSWQLVKIHPSWRFVLVDLPGHGDAAGPSQSDYTRPTNLYAAAKDLHDTVALNQTLFPGGWSSVRAAVGHSMGGRVLLKLLEAFPEVAAVAATATEGTSRQGTCALRVATLDTMPGSFNYAARDSDQDGVARVLRFVASLPELIPSRAWLQQQCTAQGFSKGMAQWMGTNLTLIPGGGGSMRLSFQLPAVEKLLESHHNSSQWPVLQRPPPGCDLHCVLATKSSRWRDGDVREQLDALPCDGSAAALHWLEGGHWLHVDNTQGLQQWLGQHILLQ